MPVQYIRDGGHVWIVPGAPERRTWWRNLRGGAAVDLVLAGHAGRGHAVVVGHGQPGFAGGLAAYLRAHPRRVAYSGCPGTPRQAPPTPGRGGSAAARCWSALTLTIKPQNSHCSRLRTLHFGIAGRDRTRLGAPALLRHHGVFLDEEP